MRSLFNSRFARFLSTLLVLALVFSCDALPVAAGEETEHGETVTVSNASELYKALNRSDVERILISAKYKHGKDVLKTNDPDTYYTQTNSRFTKIIAPENGESAVIDGRLDIRGGTVIFENVTIEAANDQVGLYVREYATVTISSVRGGDSKKADGSPAVIVNNATLSIGSASGGSAANGLGGEGIIALNSAVVTVDSATGGSGGKGVGGVGVLADSGSTVQVRESVKGGDGEAAPGQAVLTPNPENVSVSGVSENGQQLEAAKPVNPDDITTYALLVNALRSGKTEIRISSKYKHADLTPREFIPLIIPGDETVRILPEKEGKLQKLTECFDIANGSWEISGFDLSCPGENVPLVVTGNAKVSFTGNITAQKKDAVRLSDSARLSFTGNITVSGRRANGVYLRYSYSDLSPEAEITGDITVKGDGSAIDAQSGSVTVTGNLTKTASGDQILLEASNKASVRVTGNLEAANTNAAVSRSGATVTIDGNVKIKQKNYYPLVADSGTITMNGTVTAQLEPYVVKGVIILNGEKLIVKMSEETAKIVEKFEKVTVEHSLMYNNPSYANAELAAFGNTRILLNTVEANEDGTMKLNLSAQPADQVSTVALCVYDTEVFDAETMEPVSILDLSGFPDFSALPSVSYYFSGNGSITVSNPDRRDLIIRLIASEGKPEDPGANASMDAVIRFQGDYEESGDAIVIHAPRFSSLTEDYPVDKVLLFDSEGLRVWFTGFECAGSPTSLLFDVQGQQPDTYLVATRLKRDGQQLPMNVLIENNGLGTWAFSDDQDASPLPPDTESVSFILKYYTGMFDLVSTNCPMIRVVFDGE